MNNAGIHARLVIVAAIWGLVGQLVAWSLPTLNPSQPLGFVM